MNILVIVCDQLRYDALNCNGNRYVNTQNINRLASKSVVFDHAFAQSPACAPARHSLVTGKYPEKHGVTLNHMYSSPGMHTIGHTLKPHGYRRFQLGNMHWRSKDLDHGFEPWVCAKLQNNSMSKKSYKHALWEDQEITRRATAGPSIRQKDEYWGYQVATTSIKQLEEAVEHNEKFLSWNCLIEPHPPFYPPKEIYENINQQELPLPIESNGNLSNPHQSIVMKQKEWNHLTNVDKQRMKAGYYGMVELADTYVGILLDAMDRLKLWDDTIVIFTSDHGEQLGDHNLYSKFVMRESSLHIPCMIYHPEIAPGVRNNLIEQVDLFPTLCDFLQIEKPDALDGKSLISILKNNIEPENWRKEIFAQLGNTKMLRSREWKLIRYDDNCCELFNLRTDPDELLNLNDNDECQDMKKTLLEQMNDM